MDKFLIVGLGNVGDEYELTRHNTGFMVLDAFAKASNISFEDKRYGFVAETTLKGRKVILLKPSTYMNLSGNAVRYWLNHENIDQSRLLVVSDERREVATVVTTDWVISSNSSDRTMPVCVWVSATTFPEACRWTGCWASMVRRN